MMKKKYISKCLKKCLCALLVVSMFVGGVPLDIANMQEKVYAETATVGEGTYTYEVLEDGTISITDYEGTETEITIPSEINGMKVTKIGEESFYDNDIIIKVTIPEGITELGRDSFASADNLEEVILPGSLVKICDGAMSYCYELKNVELPSGLEYIGNKAIYLCNFNEITIPESVSYIGRGTLAGSTLENIYVNQNNKYFKSVDGVLLSKDGKVLIRYPSGKKINKYTIPEGVETISELAFYEVDNLTDITISTSVNKIENEAFYLCRYIRAFYVNSESNYLKAIDGVLYSYDETILYKYPVAKMETEYNIVEGVQEIGEMAFERCGNLASISIPDSVLKIGNNAFSNCENLEKIVIPDSVTEIGIGAFSSCFHLREVSISKNIKTLENGLFSSCVRLENVVIPDGVEIIYSYCFWNNVSLKSIYIPESVYIISSYAFQYCSNFLEIYGKSGSKAEVCANDNGIKFIADAEDFSVTLNSDVTSLKVGEQVTLTAAVTGKGPYKYSFLLYNTVTKEWYRFWDFSSVNTFVWTASSANDREFYVEVKDREGNVLRSEALNVTVTGDLKAKLTADETMAVTGNVFMLNVKSEGGVPPYTYSYIIHNPDTGEYYTYNGGKFTSSNTFKWKSTIIGNRNFYVDVKDSTGKVVRSNALTIASKPEKVSVELEADKTSMVVGEKITFIATPDVEELYTYSFYVENQETGEIYMLSDFNESNTYTWTAISKGNRNFYVQVKDRWGGIVESNRININVMPKFGVDLSSESTEVKIGDILMLTANAEGGVPPYTYRYIIHNPDTNEYYIYNEGKFTSSNTFKWKSTIIGNRNFYVDVKDSTGKVMQSSALTIASKPKKVSVEFEADKESMFVGEEITFIATPDVEELYTYSFYVENQETGEIFMLSDFKKLNKYTWTAISAGSRSFYVQVKDRWGEIIQSEIINITVNDKPDLAVDLSSTGTIVQTGDTLTFTANAEGGEAPYTYSFLINNTDTKEWTRVMSFGSENTYTWEAESIGNRKFYAEVKDNTGKVIRSEAVKVVTENAVGDFDVITEVSNMTPAVGEEISITGTAIGGIAPYTYSFLMYNVSDKTWTRFNEGKFEYDNTYKWKAESVGERRFYVEIKECTGKVVRSDVINISVKETSEDLEITASVDNAKPAVGESITIAGTAIGGTAPYTYSFLIHNPTKKEWYRYGNGTFKAANTLTWKASGEGKRNFYIEVKDSTGKVVRSSAVVVSIK